MDGETEAQSSDVTRPAWGSGAARGVSRRLPCPASSPDWLAGVVGLAHLGPWAGRDWVACCGSQGHIPATGVCRPLSQLLPALPPPPVSLLSEGTVGPCSLRSLSSELCAEQRPALASQGGVTWKHGTHRPPLATVGSPFTETSLLLAEGQIRALPQTRTSPWESSLSRGQSVVRKTK